jgi:hypothetical protein
MHGGDHREDQALLIRRARDLERSLWRNWMVLLSMTVVVTALSVADQFPAMKAWMDGAWTWPRTGLLVRGGLGAVLVAMAVTMTLQQKLSFKVHRRLQDALSATDIQVQNSLNRLTGILDVTRSMAEVTEPQEVFDRIAKSCHRTFECDQVSLMLTTETTDELEVCAALGHENPEDVLHQRIEVGDGIAGWVAKNRKPTLLGKSLEIKNKFGVQYGGTPLTAAMIVPIVVQNEVIGVLNVSSRSEDTGYTEEDLHALMLFAGQAGIAIMHVVNGIAVDPTPARPGPIGLVDPEPRFPVSQEDSRPLWERLFDDLAA